MRYNYDVAFSYASEDRPFVEEAASILKGLGVAVFYDRFESVGLWGKNLYTHFQDVFAKKARYVIVFISRAYIGKDWPKRELAAALSHSQFKGQPRIWPARFDDTPVPGLSAEISYQDLRQHSPKSFADLVYEKLVRCGSISAHYIPSILDEAPSSEEEYTESLVRAIFANCGISADVSSLVSQSLEFLPKDENVRRRVMDLANSLLPLNPARMIELVGLRSTLLGVAYDLAGSSQLDFNMVYYQPILTRLKGHLVTANTPWLTFCGATKKTDPTHMEIATILKLDYPVGVREHLLSEPYRDSWTQDWDDIHEIQLIPIPRLLDDTVSALNLSEVEVLGTVWPSQNQHHHTDVLLNTLDIRPASTRAENKGEGPVLLFPFRRDSEVAGQRKN